MVYSANSMSSSYFPAFAFKEYTARLEWIYLALIAANTIFFICSPLSFLPGSGYNGLPPFRRRAGTNTPAPHKPSNHWQGRSQGSQMYRAGFRCQKSPKNGMPSCENTYENFPQSILQILPKTPAGKWRLSESQSAKTYCAVL